MTRPFVITVLSLILALTHLQGQRSELRFSHLGNEDGLSHSLVASMVEDSLGFLWFGTQDGLNRYDGYGFKTYYSGNTSRSPSDSWISDLYIDQSNQLWIIYNGLGIERFDPRTETFHPYIPDPESPGSISNNSQVVGQNYVLKSFFEDSDGQLWIGTASGLNLYNRESDTFTVYYHDPEDPGTLSDNRIAALWEDQSGFLWVGTKNGLDRMDRSTGRVERCQSESGLNLSLSAPSVSCGFSKSDGTIWVGTEQGGLNIIRDTGEETCSVVNLLETPLNPNLLPSIFDIIQTARGMMFVASEEGLHYIQLRNGNYEDYLLEETRGSRIFQLLEDSKGFLWAASNNNVEKSLFRISPETMKVDVFEPVRNEPSMYGGAKAMGLLESRTGMVWIGTEKHGIYSVDLNARQFRKINDHRGKGLYLTNSEVYSIYEDNDRILYVGTKAELNRINLADGTTRGFNNTFDQKRGITWEYSPDLPAGLIGVIEPTGDGKIWMGAFDYKVSLYDPVKDRFLNFHLNEEDSTAFQLWSLRSICVTKDKKVYFGDAGTGLCRMKEDGFSFESFPVVATGVFSGTNDVHVQYIYEDADGILWIGTISGGLNRFDPGTGEFQHLVHDPSDPSSISNNRVKCILEPEIHGDEILWIGTNNGGLNRYDKRTGKFTAYTMNEGLPSNTIHGILEDKVGNLWLSTNQGLVQFDPVTEKISIYTTEDGLLGNEFNEGAFFKNRDGILYFGGRNGINYFDPEEIKEKPEYNTPVIFTGFNISGKPVLPMDTINGRVVLDRSISYTRQISLTHRERFIAFEFAALDIAAAGKLRYRYMLSGFEDSWNEVDADQRFISYTNLPSGDYTLRVMGTNSDGTVFREPSEIALEIMPPFWQTAFFKVLIAFFIMLVFLIILQVRTRMLEGQKKTLAREVEERTMDLKEANQLLGDRNDEIQEMAEKLHESDQMKLKFFTNISHEFRTPLTLLLGPTEKLLGKENYEDTAAVKQDLELMYRNERRLFKLINQLLEVRRVETGNLQLAVAEDDLVLYLNNIHQLFMPYAEKKSIDFIFDSNTSSLQVLFDADKIEKIFYNLLSNAFKYTPVKGRIIFSCNKISKEESDWVKISVQDSGPGVTQQHLPHIFDRFYQITEKHQSARISSGIGLSLSRDLVLKHHGDIEVNSDPDNGTRFDVLIPMDPEVYAPKEVLVKPEKDITMEYISSMLETYDYSREDSVDQPLVGEEMFRILVVEDNLDLQKFLYKEMSDIYNVMVAGNGVEGFEIAKLNLPDLVISDIMMPEMDGIEFTRKVKEDVLTSHIPVILLTAKSGDESQITGYESGADDYITKPFNPEVLKLKVKNILEARKQLAAKFSSDASYIPENINISQIDQGFLEKFIKLVEDNIDDTELSGDVVACELGMSKGNLYKKLKTLTGLTVNIFIRTIRLKVAARLLKQGNYNISEVAYAVGFNNPKYFSTCFSEMFSVSPKEYMK